jgi:hypothetical protein
METTLGNGTVVVVVVVGGGCFLVVDVTAAPPPGAGGVGRGPKAKRCFAWPAAPPDTTPPVATRTIATVAAMETR